MIEQLFPRKGELINVIDEELIEFKESKIEGRVNGGNAIILKDFINDVWKIDETLRSKDIMERTGLSKNEFASLKRKNKYFVELFEKYKTNKNGTFKKI